MRAHTIALALAALAVAALSGCGEKPQRLESAAEPGYQTDNAREQLRGRALNQNEARRIGT